MMHKLNLIVLVFIIFIITGQHLANAVEDADKKITSDFSSALSGDTHPGFKRALEVRRFSFPQDSGPHPEYQTEWWYYTGNLQDSSGRRFGYQLTFFRRALSPDEPESDSAWASNQIYFAHFTLSDIKNGKFYSAERWQRASLGLAGARAEPHRVWTGDWYVEKEGEVFNLNASDDGFSIELSLKAEKPIVLQGEGGLSQKGAEPGNASYYYSMTRLGTSGTIRLNGSVFKVDGLSWLDREWSTSALGQGLSGWDWFSIQLDDGREIMLYQLRKKDGSAGSHSAGTLVEKDGSYSSLKSSEFDIEVLDTWKSAATGVIYPSEWMVSIPGSSIEARVTPYQNNQELNHSFVYWEGAVRVTGEGLSGSGYVELTGYEPP